MLLDTQIKVPLFASYRTSPSTRLSAVFLHRCLLLASLTLPSPG
jgi:hypothetical protein